MSTPPPDSPKFMGHPRTLWMLLVVTAGANFAFYGFRAFLAPYAADTFFSNLPHDRALEQANFLFAGFGALNYGLAILGGWVADNVLGEVQSLRLSLWLVIPGLIAMAVPNREFFVLGLAFFVLATGLGIPLTVLIGRNYAGNDPKREAGYTLYYLAINLGAFVAPFICAAWIGMHYGYHWGFVAAAMGAAWAAAVFEWKHRKVPGNGKARFQRAWSMPVVVLAALVLALPCAWLLSHPAAMTWAVYGLIGLLIAYFVYTSVRRGDRVQGHRYMALFILFVAVVLFWAWSLLSGSALNFFARDHVAPLWKPATLLLFGHALHLPGWDFTLFQSVNPLYILILAPFMAMLWPWLDRHRMNPSTPRKFGIGLLLVALGYGVLWYAIAHLQLPDGKVAAWTLLACYLGSTVGELSLSPIGYGLVGKLAAPEEASLAMGGWFAGVSVSYEMSGQIAAFTTAGGIEAYARVFGWLLVVGIAIALVYLIAAPWIVKLMHGVR
ncbi:MAG TPA: peptide MFS transporter [Rhodanobacteraceae bacterium]|nr:peptide MFS transporter [Rhodanobacteraceae bacterium]